MRYKDYVFRIRVCGFEGMELRFGGARICDLGFRVKSSGLWFIRVQSRTDTEVQKEALQRLPKFQGGY